MSDQSPGPGWWQASDGRWYPPQQAPGQTAPTGPPSSGGPGKSDRTPLLVAGGVVALVVLVVIAAVVFLGGDDDDDDEAAPENNTTSTTEPDEPDPTTEPDEPDEPAADDAPDGFRLVEGSDGDFAMAIPEDWVDTDLGEDDLAAIQDALGEDNPQLSQQLEQSQAVLQQNGVLFAYAPPDASGASTDNLNIIRLAGLGGDVPPGLEVQTRSQLETIGVTDIAFSDVTLPNGEAVRGEYLLPVVAPDGSTLQVRTVQYFVPGEENTWVISFSMGGGQPDAGSSTEVIDTMVETFRGD
ncbi:hypothetical protein BH24ACT3_BH24ACT3_10870 [soil metagenome]